jgi:hypothetical protein
MAVAISTAANSAAVRLAELLASPDGVSVLRLLARVCDPARSPRAPDIGDSAADPQAPLGMWVRVADSAGGAEFVRTDTRAGSWHWSPASTIGDRNCRHRVVLLGESLARGYLYDPRFNPAVALQRLLSASGVAGGIEVIDLAKAGCRPRELVRLAERSLTFRPCGMVVMAGNNFQLPDGVTWRECQELAEVARAERSWAATRAYSEERISATTIEFVDGICEMVRQSHVPAIIVVPEFNLVDWATNCIEPVYCLDPEHVYAWRIAEDAYTAARARGDLAEATRQAERMVECDRGLTSRSLEALASCRRDEGRTDDARRLFEQARDTVLSVPASYAVARCFAVVQRVLRSCRHDVSLVDLPARFAEYLGGDLPDRRLFLDHCHLTLDGIRVAMASVAEHLLPILGAPPRTYRELLAVAALDVPTRVESDAHWFAALLNSECGQRRELIEFHCRRASDLDPSAAAMMRDSVDALVSSTPLLMASRVIRHVLPETLPMWATLTSATRSRPRSQSRALIDSVCELAASAVPYARAVTMARWQHHYGLGYGSIDLLTTPYFQAGGGRSVRSWAERLGFFAADRRRSIFIVPAARCEPLSLRATYRVRTAARTTDEVRIHMNERLVAALPASPVWRTERITIAASRVHAGLNVIVVEWPDARWCVREEADRVADELERGEAARLTPVFGELHAFELGTAARRCAAP